MAEHRFDPPVLGHIANRLMTEAEALEAVRQALPGINFDNLYFDEVHATRVGLDEQDTASASETGTFSLNIELQRQSESSIAFRLRLDVVRTDISFSIAAVTHIASVAELPSDENVDRVLAARVAVPFAFPYLRAKVHQLSLDMNVPPVLLGLIDPTTATLVPAETS